MIHDIDVPFSADITADDRRAIRKMFAIQGIPYEDLTVKQILAAEQAVRYGRIQGFKHAQKNGVIAALIKDDLR
jgi:hypothetical protein